MNEALSIDSLKRGTAETKDFLETSAACHIEHHAALRNESLDLVRAMNGYRAAMLDLQSRLHAAELAEEDAEIAGKFFGLTDTLRTADRLSGAVADAVNALTRHLANVEGAHDDVVELAKSDAKPVPTVP